MKYVDYYPPMMKELREIKVLGNALDAVLEQAKYNLDLLRSELYIDTATEIGLSMWERILNIEVLNPDVEVRRFEVRSRLFGKKMSLRDRLNILIGEENYNMTVDYMEYFVQFYFLFEFKELENIIVNMLERLLPLNLNYNIKYNGTFTFGSEITDYDEKKGLANDDGAIGGYFGLDY